MGSSLGQRWGVGGFYPVGERLPGTNYVVVRRLGSSERSWVFEVVQEPGPRRVVKILRVAMAADASRRAQFQAEARRIAQLDHPNIGPIEEFSELADGFPYFGMEVFEGITLRERIRQPGGIPAPHVQAILRGILEGLEHAHAHQPPILHRALRPANVFLVPSLGAPTVKLVDFGFPGGDTIDAMSPSAWRYASPEQLRGEALTPQSDLYSAGLILYECLVGRGPFDALPELSAPGANVNDVFARAHLGLEPPSIRTISPAVPEPIDALLRSALAKDPRRRPPSARDFAIGLSWLQRSSRGDLDATTLDRAPGGASLDSTMASEGALRPSLDSTMASQGTRQGAPLASTVASAGTRPSGEVRSVDATHAENKPDFRLPLGNEDPTFALGGGLPRVPAGSSPPPQRLVPAEPEGLDRTVALGWQNQPSSPPAAGSVWAPPRPAAVAPPNKPRSFAEAEVAARWASSGVVLPVPVAGGTASDVTIGGLGAAGVPSGPRLKLVPVVLAAVAFLMVIALAIGVLVTRGGGRSGPAAQTKGVPSATAPTVPSPVKPLPPEEKGP